MLRLHPRLSSRLLILAALVAPAAQAQGFVDASAELLHNDNLSRSARGGASAMGMGAGITAGYHWQPGDFTGLVLQAGLQAARWDGHSGMDSLDSSVQAQLSHKLGIGADRPVLSLTLALNDHNAATRQRDRQVHSLRLGWAQRLHERWLLRAELLHERSNGRSMRPLPPAPGGGQPPASGAVWDFSVKGVGLSGEFELGSADWLSGSWQFRDGPVVATQLRYVQPARGALAGSWDPAFGPQAAAYRLPARTRIWTFDYNRAVFSTATWYVGAEYQYATAGNGNDYAATLLRSGFIHSF